MSQNAKDLIASKSLHAQALKAFGHSSSQVQHIAAVLRARAAWLIADGFSPVDLRLL